VLQSLVQRKAIGKSHERRPCHGRGESHPQRTADADAVCDRQRCCQGDRFYTQAFGATEVFRLTEPHGDRIGHAELRIGDALLMLADEYPDFGALGPLSVGGSPVTLHLYVEDVDGVVERATAAGATWCGPVKDEFLRGPRRSDRRSLRTQVASGDASRGRVTAGDAAELECDGRLSASRLPATFVPF